MRRIEFTPEQLEDIFDKYTNLHMPMSKIGELYGVSRTVITRVLKENDIEIRRDNHVYKADYDKFHIIDTNEKAYWLGFIAADGCVYTRTDNATMYVSIHQKDKAHLKKLKAFMHSNVEIKEFLNTTGYSNKDNPTPMCKIAFNSKPMVLDFINHGIVPNKSLKLTAPNIDKQFYLPYIMGYFDGDGSIYKFNNGTEFGINFIGTYETITWINQVLELDASIEQRFEDSLTYSIRCGEPQNRIISYERCTIVLIHISIENIYYSKSLKMSSLAEMLRDYKGENCWKSLRALLTTT